MSDSLGQSQLLYEYCASSKTALFFHNRNIVRTLLFRTPRAKGNWEVPDVIPIGSGNVKKTPFWVNETSHPDGKFYELLLC